MNKTFKLKDSFYYTDLIYEIKKLAGFCYVQDEIIEQRIIEREKNKECGTGTIHDLSGLSNFQEDLFEIVRGISKKANVPFRRLGEISNYPEYVYEVLEILAKNNTENILVNYLKSMIKDMELEHAFSLGEEAEQSVCLNKNNNMWEVYIVERGMRFEKDIFEDCFDACLQVLYHLADSKQMYEDTKESFVQTKKLILNKF